jgi:prepilin-type N-terminal cleavage/methylation domain-containing protein
MGGNTMKIKKKKGFTLIELLIVVAIIAILAAIAIPQFSQYRIKGYNAAASSDIRNAKTAEEALFADFQAYGSSSSSGAASGATGVIVIVSPAYIVFTDANGQARSLNTSLSNGVSLAANTDVAIGTNYTVFARHKQGDRVFAADSNDTVLRWKAVATRVDIVAADALASTGIVDTTTAYPNSL